MRRDGLTLSITLLSVLPAAGGGSAGPRNSAAPDAAPDAALAGPSGRPRGSHGLGPGGGLLLGVLAAAVLYVCDHLLHTGSLVAAVLSVGSLAVLTRALHLDGLADLADGLGSRRPAPAALEVMRRSDIGPFGVVTLVLTLLLQVAGLTQADAAGRGPAAVIVAAVTGRLALTWACRAGVPAARADGLGALVAGTVPPVVPALITRRAGGHHRRDSTWPPRSPRCRSSGSCRSPRRWACSSPWSWPGTPSGGWAGSPATCWAPWSRRPRPPA